MTSEISRLRKLTKLMRDGDLVRLKLADGTELVRDLVLQDQRVIMNPGKSEVVVPNFMEMHNPAEALQNLTPDDLEARLFALGTEI